MGFDLANLFSVALGAILVNNFIFSQFLGICPFMGVSKKVETASGMGLAVIFVMGLASAICWPINQFLLVNPAIYGEGGPNLAFMQTVVFILVIAALVQLVEIALKRYIPALHKSLGIYLPLITTNCAVLGVTILNIDEGYGFGQSLANSFGSGLGFFLAMVLFSGVRSRMENCKASRAFEGLPITLVAAAIVAVSFFGFTGVVDTLLG